MKKILKVAIKKAAIKEICDVCILLKFVRETDHARDDQKRITFVLIFFFLERGRVKVSQNTFQHLDYDGLLQPHVIT